MGILLAALAASVLSVTTGATASPSLNVQTSSTVLTGSGTTVSPSCANVTLAVASTKTTIVLGTTSGPTDIQAVSIYNNSGFVETVTVSHSDGTNTVTLFSVAMGIGYTISYDEGAGWRMFDAAMNLQQSLGTGRFLKRTYVLNGTTTFTTTTTTSSIVARLLAGGGAGGGCPATTGLHGSGGGAGSYAEWVVAVTANTAYTCAVGAGGTGVSAASGNPGGNTTLTIGAVTCTANGGSGGLEGNATTGIVGGAGGAVSTNGTLNICGNNGGNSVTGWSGKGADSQLGQGGAAVDSVGAGNAAKVYGAGGSGGFTTGSAELGGAGSAGILIVDEYS